MTLNPECVKTGTRNSIGPGHWGQLHWNYIKDTPIPAQQNYRYHGISRVSWREKNGCGRQRCSGLKCFLMVWPCAPVVPQQFTKWYPGWWKQDSLLSGINMVTKQGLTWNYGSVNMFVLFLKKVITLFSVQPNLWSMIMTILCNILIFS